MASKAIEDTLADMEAGREIRFNDLARVCEHFFGPARHHGTSHHVYKTPWAGDPRVNIQNDRGKAKAYQVKQVLKAIARLREQNTAPVERHTEETKPKEK